MALPLRPVEDEDSLVQKGKGFPTGEVPVLSRQNHETRVRTLPITKLGGASPQQLRNKGLMLGRWGCGLDPCESSIFPKSFPHRQVRVSTQQP